MFMKGTCTMKKLTAFILALLLACGTVIGCEKDTPGEETTKHQNETVETKPVETEAPETKPVESDVHETKPAETKATETQSDPKELLDKYAEHDLSEQGFSIKGKGYYYKGHPEDYYQGFYARDLLLFDITNETDTNYTIIVTATYFDKNGKAVDLDKKKIDQFAAGYQRYVLFDTKKAFESYTFQISVTEYTGEIYHLDTFSHGILEPFEKMDTIWELVVEENDFSDYPTIMTQLVTKEQPHSETLVIKSRWILLFDQTGEIFLVVKRGNDTFFPTDKPKESFDSIILHQTTQKKLVWPEELKGELSCIVITDGITVKED